MKIHGESYERTVIAIRYQYGPFLPFLRKKDVTDIDYNMAENLRIRGYPQHQAQVTDENQTIRLNERIYSVFCHECSAKFSQQKFNTDR